MLHVKPKSKMAEINLTIVIIALNVNGLNHPIKRQKLPDWIKQHYATIYYLEKTCFVLKYINRLKVK